MKLTKAQAKILRALLSFEEIREREGGFYAEDEGWRVSIKAVNGLITRGLLHINKTHTMPSIGLSLSPVLDNDSVTEEGIDALLDFIQHLGWKEKTGEWYNAEKEIQRGIEENRERRNERNEYRKTD